MAPAGLRYLLVRSPAEGDDVAVVLSLLWRRLVRQRWCIHTHCEGTLRTCSSIDAVIKAVSSSASSSREVVIGDSIRMCCRPFRLSMNITRIVAPERIASFAGPTGVGAGIPKNGTLTLSAWMF